MFKMEMFKISRIKNLFENLKFLFMFRAIIAHERFCKSDGTQRPGENVGLRVVKYPLTPINRATVSKDSSPTIACIFWSLTVVGRRTHGPRDHESLHCDRKNWANQGQIIKTHLNE
ncbi:hypothetical protein P5V15_003793 [Pogonomyrmex californicus]